MQEGWCLTDMVDWDCDGLAAERQKQSVSPVAVILRMGSQLGISRCTVDSHKTTRHVSDERL